MYVFMSVYIYACTYRGEQLSDSRTKEQDLVAWLQRR